MAIPSCKKLNLVCNKKIGEWRFNLARNQIGDEGVTALACSLEDIATLQRLNLFENEIGDGVAAALASLLHGNRVLSIYGIEDQEGVNGTENDMQVVFVRCRQV